MPRVPQASPFMLSVCRRRLNAHLLMLSVCLNATSFQSGQLSKPGASIKKPGDLLAVGAKAPRKGKYARLPDALLRAAIIR